MIAASSHVFSLITRGRYPNGYLAVGYLLFLPEQIKDTIIIILPAHSTAFALLPICGRCRQNTAQTQMWNALDRENYVVGHEKLNQFNSVGHENSIFTRTPSTISFSSPTPEWRKLTCVTHTRMEEANVCRDHYRPASSDRNFSLHASLELLQEL